MAQKTPEQIAEKFQRRVSAAAQDYAAGVQNPSKDWATATAAAQPRWQSGIQQAMSSGAFAKGVAKAGSSKWQEGALNKGAQRFAAAAPEAAQNFARRAGEVMAAASAAQQAAARLPSSTFEERLERMRAGVTAIRSYWKSRTGA